MNGKVTPCPIEKKDVGFYFSVSLFLPVRASLSLFFGFFCLRISLRAGSINGRLTTNPSSIRLRVRARLPGKMTLIVTQFPWSPWLKVPQTGATCKLT